MTDYEIVTSHLNSLKIHYSKDWVLKCIQGFKSSNPLLPSDDLCNAVYQEWLLVNLRDLKVASLPGSILSCEKVTLTGSYAVQMESMMDCSKSSYSELSKIKGSDNISEISEEPKEEVESKRCLVFAFCDGVHEIQGMEYQPIPSFNLNDPGILPGIKLLIVGPVVCRKGMLLLKKDNVKIYGGKVESLCKTNCLESLLCKKLGINLESKSDNINETVVSEIKVNNNELSSDVGASSLSETEVKNTIVNNVVDELLSDDDDILLSLTLDSDNFQDENNEKPFSEVKSNNIIDNVNLRQNVNIDSDNLVQKTLNKFFNSRSTSDLCKKSQRQEEISDYVKNKKPKISESGFGGDKSEEEIAFQSDFIDDDSIFDSVLSNLESSGDQNFIVPNSNKCMAAENSQNKISSYMSPEERENWQSHSVERRFPVTVDSYPFIYLKQIADLTLSKPVIFTVKGVILTLKSKIIMKDDEFALRAIISDGSYAIQVNFSSDILENIMEHSPCEIASLMSEKNKNSAVSEKLKTIFLCAQQKLLSMNCLMKVKFFNDGKIPLITGLEEIQLHHVNALKGRMLCN